MMKLIPVSVILLTLLACKQKSQVEDNAPLVYKDTVITYKANNQHLQLSFDSLGNLEYMSALSDTTQQNTFFNSEGAILQVQNCRKKKIENSLEFNGNGQVERINWYDIENGTSQFLSFCNSRSRSIIIDQNASIVPVITGAYKEYPVGKAITLKLSGMSVFPSYFEVDHLEYDTTNLEISISKKDKAELVIKSAKPGIYRLRASLKATFHLEEVDFKSEAQGLIYQVDVNLTFK